MASSSRDIRELSTRSRDNLPVLARNRSLMAQPFVTNPLEDPVEEAQWASGYNEYGQPASSYFDYFFSGQDIQVWIDGNDDRMPIQSFAFNIEQKKQPIYGFWNYTYSAMMRGTRIVSGQFSIVTPYPDYVKDRVAEAAHTRAVNGSSMTQLRGVDKREENIEKYWQRNSVGNALGDDTSAQSFRHLFSSHPPFNFVCVYGVQSTSIVNNPNARMEEVYNRYTESQSHTLMLDLNERLVESDPIDEQNRLVIENVELVSMQTQYTPDGDPIAETYAFIARDVY